MSPRLERVEQMEQVFPILSPPFPFLLVRKKEERRNREGERRVRNTRSTCSKRSKTKEVQG